MYPFSEVEKNQNASATKDAEYLLPVLLDGLWLVYQTYGNFSGSSPCRDLLPKLELCGINKNHPWLVGGLEHQFYFPINIGNVIIPPTRWNWSLHGFFLPGTAPSGIPSKIIQYWSLHGFFSGEISMWTHGRKWFWGPPSIWRNVLEKLPLWPSLWALWFGWFWIYAKSAFF